jgi:hypothetical protein
MNLKKLRKLAEATQVIRFDGIEFVTTINKQHIIALLDLIELQHEAILWNWGGEPMGTKEKEAMEAYDKLNNGE